jgi:hypothetical protein
VESSGAARSARRPRWRAAPASWYGPPVSDSPDKLAGPARGSPLWIRLAPLLLVVGLAPWLWVCVPRYVDQPLNGDTGIFQYVAWCIRRGERLYDTIAMPDGPFVYLVHLPVQALVGRGEWRFRACDIAIHAGVAAAMGALLAGAGRRVPGAIGRSVWAACTACIWLSCGLVLDWYASAQRDAYYSLFGSLGLVLAYAAPRLAGRARSAALFFAGFVPALVTFGKHSGVIYLGLAGLSVLLGASHAGGPAGEPAGESWRRRLRTFLGGAAAGVAAILGFVALFGSLPGLWFWYFVYPLRVYRYLFAVPIATIFASGEPWRGYCLLGATTTLGGLAAVSLRLLPARAIGLCLAPSLQIVAFLLQQKAWPYQCQPVLAGAHLVLALGLVTVWSDEVDRRRVLAWLALLFVYGRCLDDLQGSPWLGDKPRPDVSMRERVADYLAQHTGPDDRVFYYGIDPYTLFLAQRRPAVPYPVSFVLNFAPALAKPPPPLGAGPGDDARARILGLQPRVSGDACARLVARPPAAVVITSLPPNTGADAVGDVVKLCPAFRDLLDARYHLATTVDQTRVYLRSEPD